MTHTVPIPTRHGPSRSRVLMRYSWLVLRNLLGWPLIISSFIAGPLIPGPGGIPLFLVGFALVTFPGKRRLTARVLRGRPIRFRTRAWERGICIASAILPAIGLLFAWSKIMQLAGESWLTRTGAVIVYYVLATILAWLLTRVGLLALNLSMRIIARARRRFRPWLRHHRIRLLPPRWRKRHAHERGHGRRRLTDEILRFHRKRA